MKEIIPFGGPTQYIVDKWASLLNPMAGSPGLTGRNAFLQWLFPDLLFSLFVLACKLYIS